MTVHHEDMGTWVRFYLHEEDQASADAPLLLSQALSAWFHGRPELALTSAHSIDRHGNTVDIHALYLRTPSAPAPLGSRTTFTYDGGKLRLTTDRVYYAQERKKEEK
jgi:hypothetical protein